MVISLVNKVFREERGNLAHTMEKEFPLLLSEKNSENMKIIQEDGMICSAVNFLPKKIAIEGVPVSTASIGAVCTHPHYRGRGYSTEILRNVEEKMKEIGVNLCLISGTRDLYKRWGSGRVRNSIRYKIFPMKHKLGYKLREYRREDLFALKKIYNSQKTRYLRSDRDFELLIDSGTFPFGETSYYRYVMEGNLGVRGYIILKRTPKGVVVKEAIGEMEEIFMSLANLAYILGEEKIDYILPGEERVPEEHEGQAEYLQGSLKVIDAGRFIEELKLYFRQHAEEHLVETFRVEEIGSGYHLILGDEVLEVSSHDELLQIIFEGNSNKITGGKIMGFLEKVFPLPFPWTENLNYQ